MLQGHDDGMNMNFKKKKYNHQQLKFWPNLETFIV